MNAEKSLTLLTGPWAIQNSALCRMVEVVRRLDLATYVAQQHAAAAGTGSDGEEGSLYQVDNGIAYIGISGPITKHVTSFTDLLGGASTILKQRAIRQAAVDPAVRGIVIGFDTPGGTVAGTDDLARDILSVAQQKPVYAAISDLCASAGYWLASQCSKVYANPTGMVGCIGVYTVLEDDTGWQDTSGIRLTLVSTGKYKGLGADGKVTQDLVSDTQREIDAIHELFVAAVAAGRKISAEAVSRLADGRVHIGAEAKTLGLVDAIGSLDDAVADLRQYLAITSSGMAARADHLGTSMAAGVREPAALAIQLPVTTSTRTSEPVADNPLIADAERRSRGVNTIPGGGMDNNPLVADAERRAKGGNLAEHWKVDTAMVADAERRARGTNAAQDDRTVNPLIADAERKAAVASGKTITPERERELQGDAREEGNPLIVDAKRRAAEALVHQ